MTSFRQRSRMLRLLATTDLVANGVLMRHPANWRLWHGSISHDNGTVMALVRGGYATVVETETTYHGTGGKQKRVRAMEVCPTPLLIKTLIIDKS